MKKLLCIMLAMVLLLSIGAPLAKADDGKKACTSCRVWVWPNYGNDVPQILGEYEVGDVIYLPQLTRSGHRHTGYRINGKLIYGFTYVVRSGDESLDFYAIWDDEYYYPSYDYRYDSKYRYYTYNHPALDEAIRIANTFASKYPIDIQNAPYTMRSAYDKAYNRVVSLRDKHWGYAYPYGNYDDLRDNFYKRYGYYPSAKQFYDYYGFDATYGYYPYSDLYQKFYDRYGYYPNANEFYSEYGFHAEEYPYDYRPYDKYGYYYDRDYYGYNSEVKNAVDRLIDCIRDIAQYYSGPIFREYGDISYISDSYDYIWSGYDGYVAAPYENRLKKLMNEAYEILKEKDSNVYAEVHAILNKALAAAEQSIIGRGSSTKVAIQDMERALKQVKEFKVPADRIVQPYMVGDTIGKFHPDRNVTRGELAVMLNRILGLGQIFNGTGWAERAALNLQGLGYLKGDPEGNLLLDKPISMKEMVTLLVRMKGFETIGGNVYGGRMTWATPYIQRAYVEGWLEDMKEVQPETFLTRGQVARLVNRAFSRQMISGENSPQFDDVTKMHKYYDDIRLATSKAFVK